MEMERTRRSLDRARDLASLKKPRLSDDLSRDRAVVPPSRQRALPPRVASSASATSPPVDPRFRPSAQRHKDDREDPRRADAAPYQPRQPHQQQQQQLQELVGQYKTALAELTFNSKPIITNLTIIAGENLHAAKGIAAAICAHILEVPSEQKLPSLYLLDSVVKNIGRDYIKYFAARLPEVFCKVYKQVDSSIHPGMRHLFGTWKGVFPSAPLHFIEKELFSSVTNSSSSGTTTSETDSQTQCPSHSIHVNPKYLEARQRLQRSTRSAGASNDNTDGAVNSVEDFDRPGRASNTWSARPSTTDPLNSQSPLRELVKEPSRKKGSALGERDYDFTSDLSQYPELKMGRASKRVTERVGHDSSWYGTGRDELDTSIDQKNGLDVSPSHRSYKATGSSQIAGQQTLDKRIAPLKNNHVPSRSWRNSEEEEYMWDDVNSSLTDHAGKYSSMKAGWDPDDTERPVSLGRGKWMDTQCNKFGASQLEKISGGDGRVPTTKEFEESLAQSRYQFDAGLMAHMGASPDHLFGEGTLLGSRNPSGQLRQEPTNAFSHIDIVSRNSGLLEGHQIPLSSGLSMTLNSSFTKSGIVGHSGPSSGAVSSSLGTSISSNLLPCNTSLQHPKSYGLSGQDYHQHHSTPQTSQNPGHRLGQLNPVLSSKIGPDNFPISSQNHIQLSYTTASFQTPSQISQQNEAPSPSLAPFSEMQNHLPLVQPSQPDQLDRTEIPLQLSDDTWRPSVGVSAQLDSLPMGNNSFAESSGQPSAADLLAAIMKSGLISSKPSRNLHSSNVHLLPLPSGPPPVQAVIPSTSLVQPSTDSTSASSSSNLSLEANPIRAVHPPLPPGPPPHSFLVSHVAGKADAKPNPLSNLLNVLIANGLISSTRADMLTEVAVEIKNEVEVSHQLPGETTPLSVSISDHSASTMDMSSTPSAGERPLSEPSESKGTNLSEVGAEILKDLIGFDFKPEVIRTFHPVVISALFDDLKHQCRICGLRFQLQDHLGKHLDLHDSNKSELCSQDQVFRKWFMNISDWIAGNILSESGSIDSTLIERTALSIEKNGPMVPADESQCICALCGDPFEDFYCHDTDTWMYKGTVYMMPSGGMGKVHNIDEDAAPGFIVHDQCFQGSSMDGL